MNFNELVVVERNRLYDMEKELDQCKSTKPLQMVDESILAQPVEQQPILAEPVEQQQIESPHQPEHHPIEQGNQFLSDLIQELPVKSRESAKHVLRHLFRGVEIGIDTNNYNILRFVPEKNHRIRVRGSNIYDILYALCKQAPPPMPQQQNSTDHNSIPCGMEIFLEMLSKTGLGSNHIVNCKYRNMFLMNRKK